LSIDRPPLSREQLRDVLTTALRAGQLMLENGANTALIEDTVQRFGRALGAESMDVYVTPEGIIVTAISHHEHRTRILREAKIGVDLSRVAAVIDVARRADRGELTPRTALAELDGIATQPRLYNVWLTTLSVGLACAGFSVLFGGGVWEFLVVLVASGLAQSLRHTLLRRALDAFMTTAIAAAFASGVALTLSTWLPAFTPIVVRPATVVTAAVLLLVPGVLLVSSTADMFRGDVLSGIARATSALLYVMSMGTGVWATLLVGHQVVALETEIQPNLIVAMVAALIAAGGFAVLFDVPRRALMFAGLTGMSGYTVRWLIEYAGWPGEVDFVIAGIVVGVMGGTLSRRLRMPSLLLTIPGCIPLVPGVVAFRAVVNFARADYAAGLTDAVHAVLLIIAIAIGLGTVSALERVWQQKTR
jgi:uncharacterized membrane protein YjjP (DUF1212 family)